MLVVAAEKVVTSSGNRLKGKRSREDKEPRQAERAGPLARAKVARVIANNSSRRNSSSKQRDKAVVAAAAGSIVSNGNCNPLNNNNINSSSTNSNSSNSSSSSSGADVKAKNRHPQPRRTLNKNQKSSLVDSSLPLPLHEWRGLKVRGCDLG